MTSEAGAEPPPPGRRKRSRSPAPLSPERIGEIIDEKMQAAPLALDNEASLKSQAAEHKRQIERDSASHKQQLELAETHHTQQLERDEAIHRRWKEKAVMLAGGILGIACLSVILLTKSSDDLQKAALAGVFALFTAALGFAAGKSSGKA